jgi:hypothetical protein
VSASTQRQSARRQLDTPVARDALKLRPLTPPRHPLEIAEVFRTADAYQNQARRALAEGFLPAAAYNFAYTACIDAANALVAAYGYRSVGEGGHEQVLLAAGALLRSLAPDAVECVVYVRNTARAVRHSATYERVDQVEARDAEELLLITERLLAVVERELVDGLQVTLDRLRYEEPPS